MTQLIKRKTAVGTTWAGRILHQQTHTPVPLTQAHNSSDMIIELPLEILTKSVKTNQSIVYKKYSIDETTDLLVYNDASALMIENENYSERVFPALFYLPQRITINKEKYFVSPRDILEPEASHRFKKEISAEIKTLFKKEVMILAEQEKTQTTPLTPWFLAMDSRTPSHAQTLSLLFHGLEEMGFVFTVKGRILKSTGEPGHLRIERLKRISHVCSLTEAHALRNMMEHPAFPVPIENQIHQGWDFVRSGKEEASFTGLRLYNTVSPLSAHEKMLSLKIAQDTLTSTNTSIEALNTIW
jgi:hypothetical protein